MKRRKLLNAEPDAEPRACQAPGCEAQAAYRAPHSRAKMAEYRWFCLDHARTYNAGWDFFYGMDQEQIEAYLKDDVTGHRPTWPFGVGPLGVSTMGDILRNRLRDPLEAFAGGFGSSSAKARPAPPPAVPPERRSALAKLSLGPGSTLAEIKRRYKELVKRYHPDLNGGDRAGEAQLRMVNEAYRTLVRRA